MFDEAPDAYAPERSVARRVLVPLACVAGLGAVGALAFVLLRPSASPAARPHQKPHITHIQLPPPPPPPPLKPPPEPPKKQMEKPKEQAPSPQRASVPKAAPKAPSPPAAVTTSITGPGPGSLAAGNGGGGDCLGSGCGTGGGGGGDSDAYYANIIQLQTQAALRRDEKLRYARYDMRAVLTLDAAGRVSAVVKSYSGPPEIEQEVRERLLEIAITETLPADQVGRPFNVHIDEHA